MTPNEKAREIVDKFYEVDTISADFMSSSSIDAKQCALICVNEILDDLTQSFEVAKDLHPHAQGLVAGSLKFWKEVKQEIEEL